MKIKEYNFDFHLIGNITCPTCGIKTYAWRAMGIAERYPHFYCTQCSNVFQSESHRQVILHNKISMELLEKVCLNLPSCDCGGKFDVGQNPKCPSCGFEFKHKDDDIIRLTDPYMIILDGSSYYNENGFQYKVKINKP